MGIRDRHALDIGLGVCETDNSECIPRSLLRDGFQTSSRRKMVTAIQTQESAMKPGKDKFSRGSGRKQISHGADLLADREETGCADIDNTGVLYLNTPSGEARIFYGCVARYGVTPRGNKAFPRDMGKKKALCHFLCRHLRGRGTSDGFSSRLKEKPLLMDLAEGPFGQPIILLGEKVDPCVSFSYGPRKLWAALCDDGFDVGIDAAGAGEFCGSYPYERVFLEDELRMSFQAAGENLTETAALLWSLKEAAVKALGCGFHLLDPSEVRVYPSAMNGDQNLFRIEFANRAAKRLRALQNLSLAGYSFKCDEEWVSFSVFHQHDA
ncbi:4'-phosphopantetheinyl transferase superfamily protein [Thermodesulfobacteriota bacterium]